MKTLMIALLFVAAAANGQVLVDIANDLTDPLNLDDSEPSIAVNPIDPQQIAVTAFSGSTWGNGKLAPIWMSSDGGQTWSRNAVMPAPVAGSGAVGDQMVAYGADGRLFVTTLGTGILPPRCFIFRPVGGTFAAGAAFGDDQPIIGSDNTGGLFANRRYVVWNDTKNGIFRAQATRSANDGVSVFSIGVGANLINNQANSNVGQRVTVAPNGHVFMIYEANPAVQAMPPFRLATFRVSRSDNGGVSWDANGATGVPVHAGQVLAWYAPSWGDAKNGGKFARNLGANCWIAANPVNGDVFAAFTQKDASGFGQIYVSRSFNDGVSWSQPLRVTDGTHHSAFPQIAVAANGTLGVLYVDYDNSGVQTVYRQRFARSWDLGMSWTTSALQSFTTQQLSNGIDKFLWGDYQGLTAAGHTFYGAFTGRSIGRANVQLDPIFFRVTAVRLQQEVWVRDWTDSAALADDGAEPSTHVDFTSTSDVWNRITNAAPVFNANDQPVNQNAILGATNFMNVRLTRSVTASSPTVNVKFFYGDFGLGGNFKVAGNAAGQNVTFGFFSKTATGIHPWLLPASQSNHLALAVEISGPSDPPMPPTPLSLMPGAPVSDQSMRFDNNKAQRNTAAFAAIPGASAPPVTYYAIVRNRDDVTRDMRLTWRERGVRVHVVGSQLASTGGTLVVPNMRPHETRWLGITFASAAATVSITDGRETFTLSQFPAPPAQVERESASLRRSVAARLAAAGVTLDAVFAREPAFRPPAHATEAARLHAADAAITAMLTR
jgi:hypothetical protein